MILKINTVKHLIKESIKNLNRNRVMAFSSISSVTVTLLLVVVFLAVMLNVNFMGSTLKKDIDIRVLVSQSADKTDEETLQMNIKKIKHVNSITYSSKNQELEKLINSMDENGQAFKLFKQKNPLKNTFIIKTDKPENIEIVAEKINDLSNTDEVIYGEKEIKKIFNFVNMGQSIGIILIIGLLFTAIFLISNTIKITIMARKKEIEVMRLVGATNSFIRLPFIFEGLWIGFLGSIIPIGFLLITYGIVYNYLMPKLVGTVFKLLPQLSFVIELSITTMVIGVMIGMVGSVLSIQKFLKK